MKPCNLTLLSKCQQTPEDRALRNIILPALIAACAPVAA